MVGIRRVIISQGHRLLILFVTFPFPDIRGFEKNAPHTAALEMPFESPAPSSSRSSTPPKVRDKKLKKKKEKGKTKSTAEARNEGTDPNWDYAPPPGAILVNDNVDAGEFDWDTIHNDDDLELWLIRVPESVRLNQGFIENISYISESS